MKKVTGRSLLLGMTGKRKRPRFFRSYKFVWIRSKGALLILFITAVAQLYSLPKPKATVIPKAVESVYYVYSPGYSFACVRNLDRHEIWQVQDSAVPSMRPSSLLGYSTAHFGAAGHIPVSNFGYRRCVHYNEPRKSTRKSVVLHSFFNVWLGPTS